MTLSKMIIYECDQNPTDEEIQIMLKWLKPGKMLPFLNNFEYPNNYTNQLACENYLDRLLGGYTLEFTMKRNVNETYLNTKPRLYYICLGMALVIKRRGLNLKFEEKGPFQLLIHDYKPIFDECENECDESENEGCEECDGCLKVFNIDREVIEVGLKINVDKIECHDLTLK